MLGNISTGSLDELVKAGVTIEKIEGNWVSGSFRGLSFVAKIYAKPSKFGINKGRISKLDVSDPDTKRGLAGYDRGWDIKPTETRAKDLVKIMAKLR